MIGMNMKRLKLNLLDNAINFAEEALRNAIDAQKDSQRWKFAIFCLVQSIELSLKELLKREHPVLIYHNVDKICPNNNAKTVSIDMAMNRLEQMTPLRFSKQEKSDLVIAKSARNKIVHFEVDEKVLDLKAAFARLFAFLDDFHRNHFEQPIRDKITHTLWREGMKIREYGEAQFKRAKERIGNEGLANADVMVCSSCGWQAIVVIEGRDNDHGCCYVCDHREPCCACLTCGNNLLEQDQQFYEGGIYCEKCCESKIGYNSDYGDQLDHLMRDAR